MFNSIVGVFTIEVMLFIRNFLSDKSKVIHTAIDDNNSTVFQEEALMVEVVFKGWMFNRPNMVWADVKKDTYIKSQSIDTLCQIGLT